MTDETLYSIRMRASTGKHHVSGAERISRAESIDNIVLSLIARAKSKGSIPHNITIHIESLHSLPVKCLTALDILTVTVPDMHAGRVAAARTLTHLGVSQRAVSQAIELLNRGASPTGTTMRGSLIMDSRSGERLEPDQERGVRTSRFDYAEKASSMVDEVLTALGLTHFRTREAIALATKVVHAPGVIAELCWSDDPDYTAGYVASLRLGYIRYPYLKMKGDQKGGRVIFVDASNMISEALIRYLQDEPVLINNMGKFHAEITLDQYLMSLAQRS